MSGVCCRSGWQIPVEPDRERVIAAAIERGELGAPAPWSRPLPGLPHGARAVLRVAPGGDCVFHEAAAPRLCAVHRRLGEDALPVACRQFPRVATLTPLGVSVTLSHYCPTAAGLLFEGTRELTIVSDAPAFLPSWPYEGLDARGALPPLLRPGVLMSWRSHERFEEHAVLTLAREDLTPRHAIETLAVTAERLRTWTPRDGGFDSFAERVIEAAAAPSSIGPEPSLESSLAVWERAAAAVPRRVRSPETPRSAIEPIGASRPLQLGWDDLHRPVRRWLAARAFASWLALQGEGVRTTVIGLRLALDVLRAEAARGCACSADRSLEAEGLKQAVRRSDLLLHHLVDPQALARDLSRHESARDPAWP
jgi:hypothetical protein